MACPETVCTVVPRTPVPAPAPKLAPQLGTDPISETTTKVTSCDGCELVNTPINNPVRQPTRTIVMGADPCTPNCPPPPQIFECEKTVTLSQVYTRNNCPSGAVAGNATYETSATALAYSLASLADACAKATNAATNAAQADILANGQAYANINGACTSAPLVCTYQILLDVDASCESAVTPVTPCTYAINYAVSQVCELPCTYTINLAIQELCE